MNKIQQYIEKSNANYFKVTNTDTKKYYVFNRYGAIMTAYKYGNNENITILECQENGEGI